MRYMLRPMEPADVPAVAAIDSISFSTPWPASAFQRELRRGRARYHVLLMPEDNGPFVLDRAWERWLQRVFDPTKGSRVAGYVGFRWQGPEGHITTIAVRPDHRGRGFGDLLLLFAMDRMLALGLEVVTLEMRPSNAAAYQLYRRFGFEVTGTSPGYYRDGEDAWVMAADVRSEASRRRLASRRRALEERWRQAEIEVGRPSIAGP